MTGDHIGSTLSAAFPPRRRSGDHTPAFVWPAYATAVIVMGGLLAESLSTYRKRQRELRAAEKQRR